MRKLTFIVATTLCAIVGCKSELERNIEGNWFADALSENGAPIEVDGDVVQFEFKSNNEYTFNGTLNAHEVGKFRISKDYLYTKDDLKNASEKAVRIQRLTVDSLVLAMNDKGKERILTLLRLQNELDTQQKQENIKEPDTVLLPAEMQTKK
jgi:Lipocalin-like domain